MLEIVAAWVGKDEKVHQRKYLIVVAVVGRAGKVEETGMVVLVH